ncbi:sialic acid-binding Ig-like lectin 5 [Engystomops pustulosus]|uniref:sialic acid-binding Ig-like lectin 5 n=1 Tax=Engystomops pustulosus TaxID=76066 RepID=UPI003AFB5F1C
MDVQKIFLLFIIQGFYRGFECQRNRRITALLGSCVEVPCIRRYDGISDDMWYSEDDYGEDSSSEEEECTDRASPVPGGRSCTLRIDPVRREDEKVYYCRSGDKSQSYEYYLSSYDIYLEVRDFPEAPQFFISEYLMEGEATTIRCTIGHTCGSGPPDLQWNKPGHVIKKSVDLKYGLWREESALSYTPSYEDDGSLIQCTATHRNGQRSEGSAELTIHFAPKYVTVVIIEKDKIIGGNAVTLMCASISKPEVNEYEWYKGRNKTKLPDIGWKIRVMDVTSDMEPYSCAARNTVGRGESAPMEIPISFP